MKRQWFVFTLLALILLLAVSGSGHAQEVSGNPPLAPDATALDTSFTYQGSLLDNGAPVNATCDFTFRLLDAVTGGKTIGTNTQTGVSVQDGLFTVSLDFGAAAFKGAARWLEIQVDCNHTGAVTLSPRQPLKAAPYSLGLRPGATIDADQTDPALTLSNTDGVGLQLSSDNDDGIYISSAGDDGIQVDSTGDFGIYVGHADTHGVDVGTAGIGYYLTRSSASGLYINQADTDGIVVCSAGAFAGCYGQNSPDNNGMEILTVDDAGIYMDEIGADGLFVCSTGSETGCTPDASNNGVEIGQAQDDGVRVSSAGDDGVDVVSAGDAGVAIGSTGGDGVYVSSAGTNGVYVHQSTNDGLRVCGAGSVGGCVASTENHGVEIDSAENSGVYVDSAGNDGLFVCHTGSETSCTPSIDNHGVEIGHAQDDGIHVGEAGENGVYVNSSVKDGFRVKSAGNASTTTLLGSHIHNGFEVNGAENNGLLVASADENGVYVYQSGEDGILVREAGNQSTRVASSLNNGLEIQGTEGDGIYIGNAGINGITVNSTGDAGVYVGSATGHGIQVNSAGLDGIHVTAANGYAGYFAGDVYVTGNLSKGSGSFQIDHPLDPENKYLSHSFVESPDMMNVYNGNVMLGAAGEAWVQLPDWFQALNWDFRYQLTAIGAPSPNLYIAVEVKDNRFKIAGGEPGMKVSWQVTGIRHDPYAVMHPIVVEEDKPANKRGTYLHPDAYGLPASRGVDYNESQTQGEGQ